jgi:alkylation response protein AidB-like acyl-CoA dehydrogenase
MALDAAGVFAAPQPSGPFANVVAGPDHSYGVAGAYFNGRKTSIFGGSNEIQREIITKAILEL